MNDKLVLTKKTAYTIKISTSERTVGTIGIYKTSSAAHDNSKGVGFAGTDGDVNTIYIWEDTDGKLYQLTLIADTYTEIAAQKKIDIEEKIRKNFTSEEIKFIKENSDIFKEKF